MEIVSGPPPGTFRPAQVISARRARAVFASGPPRAIYTALIDGSRCLGPVWAYKSGMRFLDHRNRSVRWAAIFALNQGCEHLVTRLDQDADMLWEIIRVAESDSDDEVRCSAVDLLREMIAVLSNRSTSRGRASR